MTLIQAISRLEKLSLSGEMLENDQLYCLVHVLWALYENDEVSLKFALADLAGTLGEEKEVSA